MPTDRTTDHPPESLRLRKLGRRLSKIARRIDHELLRLVDTAIRLNPVSRELEEIAQALRRRSEPARTTNRRIADRIKPDPGTRSQE